jgi:hypothetical protein
VIEVTERRFGRLHHEQVDEVEIERQRTINAFVVSTSRGLVSR